MVQELAKMLMGMEPSLKPHFRGGRLQVLYPADGRIREVKGVKEATSMEGVLALGIQVKPGEVIGELTGQHRRAGYVVTGGITRVMKLSHGLKQWSAGLFSM